MAIFSVPSTSRLTKSTGGEPSLTHLIDKLDSLAKFYQKQLEWVDSSTRVEINVVETDSDADDELSEANTHEDEERSRRPAARPLTSAELRRIHWRRQMISLETKLSGKAHKRRPHSGPRRRINSMSPRLEVEEEIVSQRILGMFGQIIGARMESCRRVQKLVAFHRFDEKPDARSPVKHDSGSSDEMIL
ncbi:hypothetical protein B0H12DRAFT_1318934 [Mycena haematopus]|nr:hypothetical protein B0H12DRAFT_1318934 [Mycena haematopus]